MDLHSTLPERALPTSSPCDMRSTRPLICIVTEPEYDEPLANPLPKLYHEKREDGEKARFAIKAKDQFKTPPEK